MSKQLVALLLLEGLQSKAATMATHMWETVKEGQSLDEQKSERATGT